jgi:hypothetical protein
LLKEKEAKGQEKGDRHVFEQQSYWSIFSHAPASKGDNSRHLSSALK